MTSYRAGNTLEITLKITSSYETHDPSCTVRHLMKYATLDEDGNDCDKLINSVPQFLLIYCANTY